MFRNVHTAFKWALPILPALGLLIGIALSQLSPVKYSSTATGSLVVTSRQGVSVTPGPNFAESRALSYRDVAQTSTLADEVSRSLGGEPSAAELMGAVRVVVPTGSSDLRIETVMSERELASQVTSAYLEAIATRVQNTEAKSAKLGAATVGLVVMSTPSEGSALPENRLVPAALGLLAGLALSVALIYVTPIGRRGNRRSNPLRRAASEARTREV